MTASGAFGDQEMPPMKGTQPYEYAQQVPTSRYFSVAFIDKAKRLVFINAGAVHGLNKGDRVCILDQYRVKVGCFRIRILNQTSAGFKPSKKRLAKINSGMLARFAEDGEQLDEDFEDYKTSYIEFGLAVAALSPHVFSKAEYTRDEEDGAEPSLRPGEQVQSNFTGLHLGSQVQFSASLGFATGLIARLYQPIAYETQGEQDDSGATMQHEYSVVGVGVPFLMRWFYGTGGTQLFLSEGLQWDLSYLKYRLFRKTGNDEDRQLLIRHLSVLNTLSIRGEVGASFRVGRDSRINTGLGVVLPISRFAAARSTEGSENTGNGREGVEDSVGHQKAKAAVELSLTMLLGF